MKNLVLFVLLALPAACKSGDGAPGDAAALKSSPDAAGEPLLVCLPRDGGSPKLELEIFPTGFDPQRGTTVEVFVHRSNVAGVDEVPLSGHGELNDASLDVLFDQGRLTAVAETAGSAGRTYVGDLEVGDGEPRGVSCK